MSKDIPEWLTENKDSVSILILVQPKASKTEIVGEHDKRLKIRLKAPPVDGAANKELIAFLKKRLKLQRRDIEITTGKNGRRKTVKITTADASLISQRLLK